ncbi:hypothetical protein J2T57_001687 [Natronocella acetinitrilica]|uniref:ribonucleoside-diphosphate reductase n=1 Tax=Natronocella acetinitrilica TaxID=414046 RepID=A0AAE3KAN9_9GAMM|nr:NrdJb [Natronocella acetinitrilica]MCP1674585.1 hypothetical protein [Natronocella acetinitrilica]
MAIQVKSKIVGYAVEKPQSEAEQAAQAVVEASAPQMMNESVKRPERLVGETYKIKTPLDEHAMYVTINDVILNEGTEHETRRPFEIFINSKNMDHYQWVVGMTLLISAVFRKGGDVAFLVDELKGVFDPRGGYFKKGGRFMPSLIAEIGDVIEQHLIHSGVIEPAGLDAHQQALIAEKRAQYEASTGAKEAQSPAAEAPDDDNGYPETATMCRSCNTKAVVILDGCATCLSCGQAKCS